MKTAHIPKRIRHMWPLVLVVACVFFIAGCAATNISSVSDLGSAKRRYTRILVISTFQDLMYKQAIESAFKQACAQRNVRIRTGSEILPPTREYSKEEIAQKLAGSNIDGLLIIALQGYWESQGYVPGYTTTRGTASIVGNSIVYSQRHQVNPGFIYSKPSANFESRFFDGESGKTIWRSTSLTRGNAFADLSTLANSLAGTTIDKLITDRIIVPSGTTRPSEAMYQPQVWISPEDALNSAETLYLNGKYHESIASLSALRAHVEQSSHENFEPDFLASAYFLWGACYIRAWNRVDLARQHFRKALEYKADYQPDKRFDGEISQEFERYRRDVQSAGRMQKEDSSQDRQNLRDAQRGSGVPAESVLSLSAGTKIRIVKAGASLRVGPDRASQSIRELPLGALLEVEGQTKDWIKIRLPPGSDGITIVGFVHISFVEPDK